MTAEIKPITQDDVAEKLLFPLFRCLNVDYKKKYLKNIWEQFENNVRTAAYTSRLARFFEMITNSMPIELQQQYQAGVREIIGSGEDKMILNWLRTESTYLILLARMINEKRKEEFKEKETANESDESESINKILAGL